MTLNRQFSVKSGLVTRNIFSSRVINSSMTVSNLKSQSCVCVDKLNQDGSWAGWKGECTVCGGWDCYVEKRKKYAGIVGGASAQGAPHSNKHTNRKGLGLIVQHYVLPLPSDEMNDHNKKWHNVCQRCHWTGPSKIHPFYKSLKNFFFDILQLEKT